MVHAYDDGLTMLKTRHVISFHLLTAECTVYCRAAVLFLYRVRMSPRLGLGRVRDSIYIDE